MVTLIVTGTSYIITNDVDCKLNEIVPESVVVWFTINATTQLTL